MRRYGRSKEDLFLGRKMIYDLLKSLNSIGDRPMSNASFKGIDALNAMMNESSDAVRNLFPNRSKMENALLVALGIVGFSEKLKLTLDFAFSSDSIGGRRPTMTVGPRLDATNGEGEGDDVMRTITENLPEELWYETFSFLPSIKDILSIRSVEKAWSDLILNFVAKFHPRLIPSRGRGFMELFETSSFLNSLTLYAINSRNPDEEYDASEYAYMDKSIARFTKLKKLRVDFPIVISDDSLSGLTNLTRLWISEPAILSDASVSLLVNVSDLAIDYTEKITNVSVKAMATSLTRLSLMRCPYVTDESVSLLTNLVFLRIPRGGGIKVGSESEGPIRTISSRDATNVTEKSLKTLTSLTFLDVKKNAKAATEEGLENLISLKTLKISGPDFSASKFLLRLTNLTKLEIRSLSDNLLFGSNLKELTNLTYLDITECERAIKDADLVSLTTLTTLILEKSLSVTGKCFSHFRKLTTLNAKSCRVVSGSLRSLKDSLTDLSVGDHPDGLGPENSELANLSHLTSLSVVEYGVMNLSCLSFLKNAPNVISLRFDSVDELKISKRTNGNEDGGEDDVLRSSLERFEHSLTSLTVTDGLPNLKDSHLGLLSNLKTLKTTETPLVKGSFLKNLTRLESISLDCRGSSSSENGGTNSEITLSTLSDHVPFLRHLFIIPYKGRKEETEEEILNSLPNLEKLFIWRDGQ